MSATIDGLREAASDLLAAIADAVGTRLRLAAVEVDEAQQRLIGLLAQLAVTLLLLNLALLLAIAWLLLWVEPEHRLALLGALVFCFGGGSVSALIVLRRRLQDRGLFLCATRLELAHDSAALRTKAEP